MVISKPDAAVIEFRHGDGAILCSGCMVVLREGKTLHFEESAYLRGDINFLPPRYCPECAHIYWGTDLPSEEGSDTIIYRGYLIQQDPLLGFMTKNKARTWESHSLSLASLKSGIDKRIDARTDNPKTISALPPPVHGMASTHDWCGELVI